LVQGFLETKDSSKTWIYLKLNQMSTLDKVAIVPHTKMLLSLRNNTLSNEEAVADLIDNSLDQDVGATVVHVTKDPKYLTIADNGRGMTRNLLVDALILGSQGQENPTANDLGLFGIGLKNAAGALGKKLTVITKHELDKCYTAIYDLDEIVRSGQFAIPIYPSTLEEQKRFQQLCGSETGTVLIIEKLDNLKFTDNTLVSKLKSHLGEVFRIFINNNITITVNGVKLDPVYPLRASYGEVEINDQTYDFQKPDGTPFTIRIRFGFFPLPLKGEMSKHGLNIANQGFYVLRNDRQLEKAKWFEVVAKHNDYNRLRAEIYYTGDLDDVFRTNYEKNTLKFDQWFRDALKTKLGGLFNSYKQRNVQDYGRERLNMTELEEQDLKRIKDDIESKGNRIPKLKKPQGVSIEKPLQLEFPVKPHESSKRPAQHEPKPKLPTKVELIQFDTGRLEASRICLFEDMGNGAVKIRFNVDHPFYPFFVAQTVEVKDVFAKLLFVLGRSIITLSNTEDMTITLDEFQRKFGDEYRKLLE
jgi:hypothetical protein